MSNTPGTSAHEEERTIPRGFAAARIAVILDRHVYEYVMRRLTQSLSASALIRDLLREHESLQATVAALEKRVHALQTALDRVKHR